MKKIAISIVVLCLVAGGSFLAGRKSLSLEGGQSHSQDGSNDSHELPEKFRARLEALAETVSRFSSATDVGMSKQDFSDHLVKFKGDLDLANTVWPPNTLVEEKKYLNNLYSTCQFVDIIWRRKLLSKNDGARFYKGEEGTPENLLDLIVLVHPDIVFKAENGHVAYIEASSNTVTILLGAISTRIDLIKKDIAPHL